MDRPTATAELLARHDRPGPRYTSYPSALEFDDGFDAAAYRARLEAAAQVDAPLSLYTHLPFCEARCLYCACTVVITQRRDVADAYLGHLEREVETVRAHLGRRTLVSQFHLGGGTPTYYPPAALRHLFTLYRRHFTFLPEAEIGVEVDPRVTTTTHLETLVECGVNRMSFGVQDFDPDVQQAVHRIQSVAATAELIDTARTLGVRGVNVDLIYGLPHQTVASFERTLHETLSLSPSRLAIYSFAYVPWVKHHQRRLPVDALPDADRKFELLAVARDVLTGAGYVDVGMDHFALPDDELCVAQREGRLGRTFMGYTTASAPDQIGFGMSAIGYVAGAYVQNAKKLSQYGSALDAGRLPVERGMVLSDDDLLRREVIGSWMCHFRIDRQAIEQRFGIDFDATFADELDHLAELERQDFVRLTGDAVEGRPLGRLFARNVAMVFDRYLQRQTATPRYSRTV